MDVSPSSALIEIRTTDGRSIVRYGHSAASVVQGTHRSLSGADLSGLDLSRAELESWILRGANLTGCRLVDANLRYADLAGAIIRRVDVDGADLTGASLRGADLRDTDISRAILDDTDLAGALFGPGEYAPAASDPDEGLPEFTEDDLDGAAPGPAEAAVPVYSDDDMLTPAQACKFAGVSRGAFVGWRRKGLKATEVPGAKRTVEFRYRFGDLRAFLEQRARQFATVPSDGKEAERIALLESSSDRMQVHASDVALLLGVSRNAVHLWRVHGDLPGERVGLTDKWVFRLGVVREFRERRNAARSARGVRPE